MTHVQTGLRPLGPLRVQQPPDPLNHTRATSLSLGRAPTLHWPRSCLHALYQRRRVCAESQSCDCPALRGASALIFSSSLLPLGSGAPPCCSCRLRDVPSWTSTRWLIRSCSRAKDASPPPATYSLCSPPTARVREPGAEPPQTTTKRWPRHRWPRHRWMWRPRNRRRTPSVFRPQPAPPRPPLQHPRHRRHRHRSATPPRTPPAPLAEAGVATFARRRGRAQP